MNDPVLDRAMFRNQTPVSSYGTGITSNVASPDEAARALQMAFQPTGYAGGGPVINGVKHFQQGGENVSKGRSFLGGMFRLPAPDQMLVPKRYTPVMQDIEDKALTPSEIEDQQLGEAMTKSQFSKDLEDYMKVRKPTEDQLAAAQPAREAILNARNMGENIAAGREVAMGEAAAAPPRPGILDYFSKPAAQRAAEMKTSEAADAATLERMKAARPAPPSGITAIEKPPAAATPVAVPPPTTNAAADLAKAKADADAAAAGSGTSAKKPDEESGLGKRLSLRIDELKQEREANKSQRRENQLLALMQAGFQAAAGKSSSALTNIAGGGAAGIATLADLEKTRRAEDTALRSESLQLELAKEKMIESSKERAAALAERGLSRDITGLKAVSDANKGLIISYENQILALEKLQDAPATPDDKKKEYGQLIAQKRAEIDRLGFDYRQQAQGLLPKGMRTPNLDFQTTVRGSKPTQAGT
jgi:hypothetical protein